MWRIGRLIRTARRDVIEVKDPKARSIVAEVHLGDARACRRRVERFLEKCKGATKNNPQNGSSRWERLGPGFLFVALAAWLADATTWFATTVFSVVDVPIVFVLAGSLLVAAFLAGVCHVILSSLLLDPLRFDRTARRLFYTGCAFSAVAVWGLFSFLSVRGASPEEAGQMMRSGWAFLCVNIGFPIAAGAFSALGTHLTSRIRAERGFNSATDALADLAKLETFLQDQISSFGPVAEGTHGHDSVPPLAGPSLAMATEAPRWDGRNSQSRGSMGKVPQALPVLLALTFFPAYTTEPESREAVCPIGFDATASGALNGRVAAASFLRLTARELVEAFHCTELEIIRFTDRGRFSPRLRISIPSIPKETDCTQAEPEPLQGINRMYGWFANVQEARRHDAEAACVKQSEAVRAEATREWSKFEREFSEAITVGPGQANVQTHIGPILEGVARRPNSPLAVVVTDGIETPRAAPRPVALPDTLTVVMLVIPPSDDFASGAEALALTELWERAVPGLKAIPITEAYEGIWRELAAQRGLP